MTSFKSKLLLRAELLGSAPFLFLRQLLQPRYGSRLPRTSCLAILAWGGHALNLAKHSYSFCIPLIAKCLRKLEISRPASTPPLKFLY